MPVPILPRSSCPIAARYRHDRWAYTQGLAWHAPSNTLYESTGRYGDSSIRRLRLDPGPPPRAHLLARHNIGNKFFGEGLAILDGRVYQLTWRERIIFVYDLELRPLLQLPFDQVAWGFTTDGENLIYSDGSDAICALKAETLQECWRLKVHEDGRPITRLNDLEYVPGPPRSHFIANIYRSNRLVRIDAKTGAVLDYLDLAGLLPWYHRLRHRTIFNGVAWRPDLHRLLVTGKYWPHLYELELPPISAP